MELEETTLTDESVAPDDDSPELDEIEESGEARITDGGGTPRLDAIIESLLFAAGTPVALRRLVQLLDGPSAKEVIAALSRLHRQYDDAHRGLRLVEVAGGYQFRTAPENADWVRSLLREKPTRIGRATLETLAIVAYKQPATRTEIEAIRGVDVDGALASLLAKRLIKIAGRKETVGRPLLYATTPEFLEVFGLKDLDDLPTLKELPTGEASDDPSEPPLNAADTPAAEAAAGAAAETFESGGSELAANGGATDSRGQSPDQRSRGDRDGDEGGPED